MKASGKYSQSKPANKYGVRQDTLGKLARTYQGILYDSKAECERAVLLDCLKRNKVILEWERQVPVTLRGENEYSKRWFLDFQIFAELPGHVGLVTWYEDVKGKETTEFKILLQLYQAFGALPLLTVKRAGRNRWTLHEYFPAKYISSQLYFDAPRPSQILQREDWVKQS